MSPNDQLAKILNVIRYQDFGKEVKKSTRLRGYIKMIKSFNQNKEKVPSLEAMLCGNSRDMINLVKDCLQLDPEKRPTALECLQRPIFDKFKAST